MADKRPKGQHWILSWMEENQTATYFFRSMLFTYFNYNISLWFFKSKFRSYIGKHFYMPVSRLAVLWELKLSCNPVVKKSIYSNSDLDLWPNDPKINRVLPLPQGNHVAKFVKDPIYRTKVIVQKFSSVYRIFTKLGYMIPLWKGKNPIYFGVIRSKVTLAESLVFKKKIYKDLH
jgi:hypothetical protein